MKYQKAFQLPLNRLLSGILFVFLIVLTTGGRPILAVDPADAGPTGGSDYTFTEITGDGQTLDLQRFQIIPNLLDNKWPDNVIQWYYNPALQSISTEKALDYISRAMVKWSNVSNVTFEYMGLSDDPVLNEFDEQLIIGWLDPETFEERHGQFGMHTRLWWSVNGNGIADAYLAINNSFDDEDWFHGVMTHEIGHLLGFAHSNEPGSIMFALPYHTPDYMKTLKLDDIAAVSQRYPQQLNELNQASLTCTPFVGETLALFLPVLALETESGADYYWAELAYEGETIPGAHTWKLVSYGKVNEVLDDPLDYFYACDNIIDPVTYDISIAPVTVQLPGDETLVYVVELEYQGEDENYDNRWTLVSASLPEL